MLANFALAAAAVVRLSSVRPQPAPLRHAVPAPVTAPSVVGTLCLGTHAKCQ